MIAGSATFKDGAGEGAAVLTSAGRHDGHLASYDRLGALQWVNQLAGSEHDELLDARVLADGSTVVVGYFTGGAALGAGQPGETLLHAEGALDQDVVMAGFDANGLLTWATSFGGPGDDNGVGLMPVADGSWIVTGSFKDQLTFDGAPVLTGDHEQACAFFPRVDEHGGF